MKRKTSIFFFNILLMFPALSQRVAINSIRVGIDPIRSASMLLKEKDAYHHRFYYNVWEMNAEVIGPYRTSFIAEAGYTKAHLQPLSATLDYHSEGYFARVGLDFNLLEDDSRFEFDIGWRYGINTFKQHGAIKMEGHYWVDTLTLPYAESWKTLDWGEVIFNQKIRLFYQNEDLNDLWFGIALRMKFMNGLQHSDGLHDLMIPGYGAYGSISVGLTFSLCYQFHIKRSVIHDLLHKHDNEFITK